MSKKKIDKPKVFISYAWGTKQYQDKVLAFATQLMGDGIEVVLDKWDLNEGNDTYAFMEKCVNDPTITNVLMLIDPVYASKADTHSGGVGTETQIISAKVYQEVTQDKFIPIVYERDENGNVCKPTYLQGRLHFDLSSEEKYDDEYIRLVKTLYGEEVYHKPDLGSRPTWVDQTERIEIRKRTSYESLKTIAPDKARKRVFNEYLKSVLDGVNSIIDDNTVVRDTDDIIPFYKEFRNIRTEYLALIEYSAYVIDAEKVLSDRLEAIALEILNKNDIKAGIAKVFLHELFLYTIAYFLGGEDYEVTGHLLGRTYYNPQKYHDKVSGFDLFYCSRGDFLDRAMNERDKKKYISGTATYWIENIDIEHCTKEQFLLADLICYNYYIYGKDKLSDWHWFPVTYIYDNEDASVMGKIGRKLISKEYVTRVLPLFGYDTIDEFKNKISEVSEGIKNGQYKKMRYPESWHEAPILNSFIDLDRFATVR